MPDIGLLQSPARPRVDSAPRVPAAAAGSGMDAAVIEPAALEVSGHRDAGS
jgi:hypothetical protein